MPSWSPFSATSRTSGAVISRLMRCDLSSAMSEKLLNTLKKTAVLSRSSGVLARYPGRRCARPPMSQNFIDFCRRRLWSEAALRRQALAEAGGPVQRARRCAGVVRGHVGGAAASRHAEVHLHRAALPWARDAVLEVVFDLRAVERALPWQERVRHAGLFQRRDQRLLGLVPD